LISLTTLLLIVVSGLVAGFLTGLVSLGGAFIVVPALYHALLALDVPSHAAFTSAVATSLAFLLFSSTSATSTYAKKQMIDYRLASIVSAGALLGIWIGIQILLETDDAVVRKAFGIFIWVLGAYVVSARYFKWGGQHAGNLPSYTMTNQMAVFCIGGGVGVLVGAFGIGGGGIIAPAIAMLTRSDMKRAIATGVGATVIISIVAAGGYVVSGLQATETVTPSLGWVYLPALILLVPAAMVSAPLGARLAMHLSQSQLLSILGASMFIMGAKFIYF